VLSTVRSVRQVRADLAAASATISAKNEAIGRLEKEVERWVRIAVPREGQ